MSTLPVSTCYAQLHAHGSDLFSTGEHGWTPEPSGTCTHRGCRCCTSCSSWEPDPAVMPSAAGSSWLSLHHVCYSFTAGMKSLFCKWYMLSLPQQHPPGKHIPQHTRVLHRDTRSPELNIIQRSEEQERRAPPATYGGLGQRARGPGKDEGEGETGGGNSTK